MPFVIATMKFSDMITEGATRLEQGGSEMAIIAGVVIFAVVVIAVIVALVCYR